MSAKAKHYPISAEPWEEEDWRRCACGTDLSSLTVCPDTEIAECGCPLYAVEQGEHWGCLLVGLAYGNEEDA